MTSFNTAFPTTKPLVIHYPRFALPAEHDGLPLVGMVRNPWDWYVSWYAFNRQPYVFNMLFEVLSDDGHSDFKTTVTSLVNLGSDDIESRHYRNVLISVFPETLEGNRGVGLTKDCIRGFSDNETGYCSWLSNACTEMSSKPIFTLDDSKTWNMIFWISWNSFRLRNMMPSRTSLRGRTEKIRPGTIITRDTMMMN